MHTLGQLRTEEDRHGHKTGDERLDDEAAGSGIEVCEDHRYPSLLEVPLPSPARGVRAG
jgi:hypothetical protein